MREARPDDHDVVGALTVEAFRDVAGTRLGDDYAAELADVAGRALGSVVLVAERDGVVAGSVAYVRDASSPLAEMLRPGEAGIRMLAVAPGAQRGGVGAALLAACVERARADGRVGIALFSTDVMVAAHRLYLRAGFRRARERDWEPSAGLGLLSFVKELR